jgi:uncharacterized protein
MNPQETALLEQFLENLVAVKGVSKIPDADQLIRRAVARQPDAAYLLVQRCLLLDQALAQAKSQIAALEQSQASNRSFLDTNPQSGSFARSAAAAPPPVAAAMSAPVGGGAGSFLGQAAATAAGVAGGAFLFEGLEHLFGGNDPGFGSGGFSGARPEDVVVNNYYEGDDRRDDTDDDDGLDDDGDDDDQQFDDDDDSDFT